MRRWGRPSRVLNVEVRRIEQERACGAARRAGMDVSGERELRVAGGLYESAIAAARTGAGENRSSEGGFAVGPQHDLAAVAASGRRRVDGRAGVDADRGCRRDREAFELGARVGGEALVRIAAAPVAPDHHLAAPGPPGPLDPPPPKLDLLP